MWGVLLRQTTRRRDLQTLLANNAKPSCLFNMFNTAQRDFQAVRTIWLKEQDPHRGEDKLSTLLLQILVNVFKLHAVCLSGTINFLLSWEHPRLQL